MGDPNMDAADNMCRLQELAWEAFDNWCRENHPDTDLGYPELVDLYYEATTTHTVREWRDGLHARRT